MVIIGAPEKDILKLLQRPVSHRRPDEYELQGLDPVRPCITQMGQS